MQSMTNQHSNRIGRPGYWLLFSGIPFAIGAILFVFVELHHIIPERLRNQNMSIYIFFFTPVVIVLGFRILYQVFPKKMIIPCGVLGWMIGLCTLYWFFWFGPGAWGHHAGHYHSIQVRP